jgi:hypothetical protein
MQRRCSGHQIWTAFVLLLLDHKAAAKQFEALQQHA